jgi:hypothetical protein
VVIHTIVLQIQLVSAEGSSVSDNKSQGAAERIQDIDSVGGDGEKSDKSNRSADNGPANNSR